MSSTTSPEEVPNKAKALEAVEFHIGMEVDKIEVKKLADGKYLIKHTVTDPP
jgi:hypothetical protein